MSAKEDIEDLLYCAFKFDDKPHLLFACIMRLARKYEPDKEDREEIIRLMDEAYNETQ